MDGAERLHIGHAPPIVLLVLRLAVKATIMQVSVCLSRILVLLTTLVDESIDVVVAVVGDATGRAYTNHNAKGRCY